MLTERYSRKDVSIGGVTVPRGAIRGRARTTSACLKVEL